MDFNSSDLVITDKVEISVIVKIIDCIAKNVEIEISKKSISKANANLAKSQAFVFYINKLESRIEELEKVRKDTDAENIKCNIEIVELKAEVAKLRCDIDELKKASESKKNCKFQTRCIQIAKEILNEEPMIKYRLSFLNGL
ncbi:20495_t:CDS:2 [Funneliformis geosporum]|nr:20495_t:CDS:2 [Funneliformis geosporum]